jgi:hypothetical protein
MAQSYSPDCEKKIAACQLFMMKIWLPAADYAAIDAFAAANGLMADVPEPTSFGLIGLAGAGVLARRRRTACLDLEVRKRSADCISALVN